MDMDGEGAVTGAVTGAGIGAMGGAPGALIGAGLGALGGSFGLFGKKKAGYQLPWDQYNARLSQIGAYQTNLNSATANYKSALTNMYQTTFNQYMPNLAAQMGGSGLSVNGGAYAQELARQSAAFSSQGMAAVAQQDIKNLNSVDDAYGNAWSAMFGAANSSNKAGFDAYNSNTAAMGRAAFAGLSRGMSNGSWGGGTDHFQQSGMAGFGEGTTDLSGKMWGF